MPPAAWLAPGTSGDAARMSRASEVVQSLATSFTPRLLDRDSGARDRRRRAQWLVRVIVSLLTSPAGGEDEERVLLQRFVAPVLS